MPRSTRALIVASALTAFAAGCDNPFTEAPLEFRFTGADITAAPGTVVTLEVQLVANGRPRAGREIVFEAPDASHGAYVAVSPTNIERFAVFVRTTTNDRGRAFARVRLGIIPGRAAVIVSAEGAQDTAWYTVRAAP